MADGGKRRQQRAQGPARRRAERRHRQALALGGIGGDDGWSAGDRDHRHARRRRPAHGNRHQRLDGVEELLRLLGQHDPRTRARGAVDLPRPGQRARVRARRAAAGVGASALEHHDRLAPGRAARRRQKARPVPQRLDEARDQRRGRIVDEPFEDLGDLDVDLVADRHEARDAETTPAEVTEDEASVGAALRGDRDAARRPWQIPEVRAVEPRPRWRAGPAGSRARRRPLRRSRRTGSPRRGHGGRRAP